MIQNFLGKDLLYDSNSFSGKHNIINLNLVKYFLLGKTAWN